MASAAKHVNDLTRRWVNSLHCVCAKYWRRRSGYVYSLSPNRASRTIAHNGECRLVNLDIAGAQHVGSWSGVDAATVEHRLRQGDRCLGLSNGEKPDAALWLHAGDCYVRGADLWIKARTSAYYCYGVITKPSERGKGLYRELLSQLTVLADLEAVESIIQYVESSNTIPQAVLPFYGYEPLYVSSSRWGVWRHVAVYDTTQRKVTYHWRTKEPPKTCFI